MLGEKFKGVVEHQRRAGQQMSMEQRQAETVMQWQDQHHAISWLEADVANDVAGITLDVTVGDHHRFRRASGSRGEHQRCQIRSRVY
jgi:hypothetical protein